MILQWGEYATIKINLHIIRYSMGGKSKENVEVNKDVILELKLILVSTHVLLFTVVIGYAITSQAESDF